MRRWWERQRWPLPGAAALGATSFILLLAQLGPLVTALYANADNATTLLLAGNTPSDSITKIGDHPFLEAWWFMRLTAHLPAHIAIWQGAPFVLAALGIGALVACAAQVAGRPAAMLAAAMSLALSGPLRAVLLVPEARVGLVLHAAVLCWTLLLISRWQHAGRMSPRRWTLSALGVVAFTAPGATDALLLPGAVLPFVAAALVGWYRERTLESRALLSFALGTSAGAYGVAHEIMRLMTASGVVVNNFPLHTVGVSELSRSFGVTLHLFAILAGGDGVAGAVALGGLGCAAAVLVRDRSRLWVRPASEEDRAQLLFTGFWAAVLLLSIGAVAGTSVSLDHAVHDAAERYLLGAWCATIALLAASARTRLRINVLSLGACGFTLLVLVSNLQSVRRPWEFGPPPSSSSAIGRFALAHGASVGYGGYWDVMPIGLAEPSVRTVPIVQLGATDRWAGHFVAANSAWFRTHATRASFLVVDTRRSVPYAPHLLPQAFGQPVARRRFGLLTVYIYAHDLARDLDGTSS